MTSNTRAWWRKSEKQWPLPIRLAFVGMLFGTGISILKVGPFALIVGAVFAAVGLVLGALYEPIAFALRERKIRRRVGKGGFTELMCAAAIGNIDSVVLLLSNRVDINAQDYLGASALMYAASEGNTEIVGILMNAGANAQLKTKHGNTALSLATNNGSVDIVEILNQQSSAST